MSATPSTKPSTTPAAVAQNWQDLAAERARTAGIRNQTANLSLQYSTGVGARGGALVNGWKGVLFKDWTVMPGVNVASGAPITIDGQRLIRSAERPRPTTGVNYVGGPAFINGVLNAAAFAARRRRHLRQPGPQRLQRPHPVLHQPERQPHFPPGRPQEPDLQRTDAKPLEPPGGLELVHIARQQSVRLGQQLRRHAHHLRQHEVQFLMRNTLVIVLAALLIASAQQATQPPAGCAEKERARQTGRRQERIEENLQLFRYGATGGGGRFRQGQERQSHPQGLKADDFTISEDGKPQKITSCPISGIDRTILSPRRRSTSTLTTRGPVLGRGQETRAQRRLKRSPPTRSLRPKPAK